MNAIATVTVTLEIVVPDRWGNNCTLEQVYRQAERSAVGAMQHAIHASNIKAKIVGKPEVSAVVTTEKKGGAQ